MSNSWVIKNGTVVSPEWGLSRMDILIRNGIVTAVADRIEAPADVQIYDAEGLHVFPGFMDCHVHLGNYNDFLDDVKTETAAAAAGGVTHLMTFIKSLRHAKEQVSYKRLLPTIIEQINHYSSVDVGMHIVISTREHIDEMRDYLEMGGASFKFYIGYRGSAQAMERGSVSTTDGFIYVAFKEIAKLPAPALAMTHCENEEITHALQEEMGEQAWASYMNFANGRPIVGEAEGIGRALAFAKDTGCPLYIVHCSSKAGLERVKQMRQELRTPVYVEATTHHLTLTAERINREIDWALAKTTPPPRDQESIDALWNGIRNGDINCVGTDHCAMGPEKRKDFESSHPGFIGLQTFPSLMLTEAAKRNISPQKVAQVCIYNPAKVFGLLPNKGTLRPGADGDVAIFNLRANYVVDSKKGVSMTKISPYDGWKLTAEPEATLLRGELIYRRGETVVPGKGRALVKRMAAEWD